MRRRGLSIIEVVIAASLVLLLLLCCEAAVRHLHEASRRHQGQLDARKYARAFLSQLKNDLMASSHLFLGQSKNLLGQEFVFPKAGEKSSQLLFAVPEEDGVDPRYTVVLVYDRMRSKPDPNNPDVRELVYHRFLPGTSSPPHIPGALINQPLMAGSERLYDCYLPAGPVTDPDPYFCLAVAPNGKAVEISLRFRIQPERGAVVSERYHTFVALRNNG